MLGTKCERVAPLRGDVFGYGEEGLACVGEGRAGAMDEPEAARDFQLGDGDLHQFAAGQFRLDGEARDERDAIAARHEALDGFETGQFDAHVERGLMAGEGLDNALAER